MRRTIALAVCVFAFGCSKSSSGSTGGSSGSAGSSAGNGSSTSGTSTTSTSTTGASTSGTSSTTGSSGSVVSSDPDVPIAKKDVHRSGLYIDSAFTKTAAANIHPDSAFAATYTGKVYAQPLFIQGKGGSPDLVIVATANNDVFGFNAQTGAQVWTVNLGASWPLNDLPCGNVDPNGVTGTGAIDLATRTLYVDALVHNVGHQVFAIDGDTGAVKSGWPVLIDGVAQSNGHTFNRDDNGNDISVQQQRGGMIFSNGKVYIPFGGFYDDCGDYYGWVVAIDAASHSVSGAWATRANGGGIWAVSGPSLDGDQLFVSTGNTFVSGTDWQDGEAIVDLGPNASFDPSSGNFWAPTNWKYLDDNDIDMSGTAPLLFDVGGYRAAMAMGKDGNVYILNRDRLGGISDAPVTYAASGNEIINGPAMFGDANGQMIFYVSQPNECPTGSGDLGAIRVSPGNPPTVAAVWCADEHDGLPGGGSPIVTSPDGQSDFVVWGVGAGGDNKLYAWDALTGAALFDGTGSLTYTVQRFQAPIVAKGRLYLAASGHLESYVLQ